MDFCIISILNFCIISILNFCIISILNFCIISILIFCIISNITTIRNLILIIYSIFLVHKNTVSVLTRNKVFALKKSRFI